MYICICNAITDSQIKCQVAQGARSLRDLNKQMCIADQCGMCAFEAKKVIKTQLSSMSL